MQVKESWDTFSDQQAHEFLSVGHEGKRHPSRQKAVRLLEGMKSVLDVGCGPGVMFELIREQWPSIEYLGMDSTAKFVEEARRRYPECAGKFQQGSLFELGGLEQKFDAVLCRHILEHLPDYVPAVQRMYEQCARKLILVFYLPPRPLRFGRKRDEKYEKGFYTHTYDLGHFVHHLVNELSPMPSEVRVYPRQGTSDPSTRWGHLSNVIYEVVRAAQ